MKISKKHLHHIIKEELTRVVNEDCRTESDGCTGVPDRDDDTGADWRHCCVEHDCCYDAGGSEGDRKNCDILFRDCVNQNGGPGDLYYMGVRQFGKSHFGKKKKVKLAESHFLNKKNIQRMIREEAAKIMSESMRPTWMEMGMTVRHKDNPHWGTGRVVNFLDKNQPGDVQIMWSELGRVIASLYSNIVPDKESPSDRYIRLKIT